MGQGQNKGNKNIKHMKDERNEFNKQGCPRPQNEGI
jgi:hypothetical protein